MSNKASIGFRLRKDLDNDIRDAIANLPPHVVSDLCRNGLRLMLGIRTTKRLTVAEQPLNVPHAVPDEGYAQAHGIKWTNPNKKG